MQSIYLHFLLLWSDFICIRGQILAIDSDYLYLDIRPTSLPYPVGNGIFAKYDIPSNEVQCELRGPVITTDASINSDKLFTTTFNQIPVNIVVNTVCTYMNDCADILGRIYSRNEIELLKNTRSYYLPTYPGYSYNAAALITKLGKVFIMSQTEIKAGDEIFFAYGA